jgi:ATP-dependent Clp protease adaptor protein ClpS
VSNTATITETDLFAALESSFEKMYAVLVLNDDVTPFDWVLLTLMDLFGYSPEEAHDLTMKVHTTGQAVVQVCDREQAEGYVKAIHERQIQATYREA